MWANINMSFSWSFYMLQMAKYYYFRFVSAVLKMREQGRQHSKSTHLRGD